MYKYKTEIIKIPNKSKESIDDKLNEFGLDNWNCYSLEHKPYYDSKIAIRGGYLPLGEEYTVRLKQKYYDTTE